MVSVVSHRFLIFILMLPLGACSGSATGGNRSALLLSDKPAPRRTCEILSQPHPLPSLSQLADSAALLKSTIEFAQRHPIRDGSMRALYTVAYTADGRVDRLTAIDYWLPQGQAEAFTSLVRGHLRPQLSGAGNVRLLLESGGEKPVRIGRSERCPPESRTRFKLVAPALAQQVTPHPVRIRIHVDAQGRVQGTHLLSSSGSDELDRWVARELQVREFSPGLIDGIPVNMDYEEIVRIEARP